ncbi:replication/maintenance protein RepL [Macrococcus animalis]|uniref:replication/maintenance protein RepL n=1 Tax=Macrococcus animalis TaxID=3395467 RepID=UPI0039BE727F
MKYYWGASIIDSYKIFSHVPFNKTDYTIFFYLINLMDNENNVYIKQSKLSQELEIDKSNISRSIEKLKEWQFITKIKSGFMINPSFIYINKSRDYERNDLRNIFSKYVIESGYSDEKLFFEYDEDHKEYRFESFYYGTTDMFDYILKIEKDIERLKKARLNA